MKFLNYTLKLALCLGLLIVMPSFTNAQVVNVATNPANLVNCAGSNGNFLIVVASSTNPTLYDLVYDWYKDGVSINGPKKVAGNYTFGNLPLDYKMSGRYMVKIWTVTAGNLVLNPPAAGSNLITTPEIDVNVLSPSQMLEKIPNQYAALGSAISFQASAHIYGYRRGLPNDYKVDVQWFRGNTPLVDNDRISGSNADFLTIRNIKATDYDSTYRVVITGQCGTIGNGSGETFSILTPPAISITQQPVDFTTCAATWYSEKIKASINTKDALMYQWYSGTTKIFDKAGLVTGSTTDSLAWVVSAGDMADVWCKVSIKNDISVANTNKVRITGVTGPQISAISGDMIATKGKPFTLMVTASSNSPLDTMMYQWWKDSVAISGATLDSLMIASADAINAGIYKVVVTGRCGSVTSKPIAVTVSAAGIVDNNGNGGTNSNNNNNNASATTSGVDNTFELNNGIMGITPNPTNNQSVITIKNEVSSQIKLSLTNSAGAKIADLVNEFYTAGSHTLNLNLNDMNLTSGAYYLNIAIGSWSQTKQIVVVR